MKKLKKFNKLYNKLIFESTEQQQQRVQLIRDCDLFFKEYILTLAEKCQVIAQKNRENTFRIAGKLSNVFDFFNNFKVDAKFNNQDEEFVILSPLVTYGEIKHLYNNGKYCRFFDRTFSEGNQLIDAGNEIPTTRTIDDQAQIKIEGKWYNLYFNTEKNENVPDFNVPKILRKCTPVELRKALQVFVNNVCINDTSDFICVEFVVDCNKIMNSYDKSTKAIQITYSDKNGNVLDVADTMNNEDKIEKPTVITKLNPSEDSSLVGDTKKIIRKTKKTDYNTKNKTKVKTVK